MNLAGILTDANTLGEGIRLLLTGVVMLIMGSASVIATYGRTQSPLKATVAGLGAGVVLGIVASMTVLSDNTADTIENPSTMRTVQPTPAAPDSGAAA